MQGHVGGDSLPLSPPPPPACVLSLMLSLFVQPPLLPLLLDIVNWPLLEHMLGVLTKHTHDLSRRMSVCSTADMAPFVTFSGIGEQP